MEKTRLINPGGSLGDRDFPIPEFENFAEFKNYMELFHGYEVSNNLFFASELNRKEVAEVGCGHGLITFMLSSHCKSITGFDVDTKAINYAESLNLIFNFQNVKFQNYDGKFSDVKTTFDIAISMDVIEHVKNPVEYLKEVYKILKTGGVLLLGTPNGMIANKNKCIVKTHSKFHIMEYTPNELASFLQNAGFRTVEFYTNKNVAGGGYDISTTKKIIIKLLCKLDLFDWVVKLLSQHRSKNLMTNQPRNNSIDDWKIKSMEPNDINAHNCDVIICKAIKV